MSGKVAIVYGANGISGTASVTHLLSQTESAWSRVIAVSRRPPQVEHDDPRLAFLSMDFMADSEETMTQKLKEAGAGDADIALFYAYIAKEDENDLIDVNKTLFDKALKATHMAAPKLSCFCLQTGYKHYGVHKGPKEGILAPAPFKEDAPRHGKYPNFYYVQEDMLKDFAKKAGWHWVVARPNFIIGVSRGNFMNLAVSIAIYATVRKHLNEPLIFPGNSFSYNCIYDHSTALNNAEFEVWAATHDKAYDQAFNIKDGENMTMRKLWPQIALYFGLLLPEPMFCEEAAINPERGALVGELNVADYMKDKKTVWEQIAQTNGLDPKAIEYATFDFVDFALARTWSDDASMDKAKEAGWEKTVDTWESYKSAFDEMRKFKMIP